MRWACAMLLVAGCDNVFGLYGAKMHPDAGVRFEKSVILTSSATTTVTNLPISITIASDPDLAMNVAAGATNLAFYANETLLPTEIVGYTSDGSLEAWVQVPSLAPGMTTLAMRYGGPERRTQ
ncbi:MAG: hypothetical protein QM831_03295 [Kofleriaceae bacterium]